MNTYEVMMQNLTDEVQKLKAERNALLEDVGRVSRIRQEQKAEIERLKALLEPIWHDTDFQQPGAKPTTVNDYMSILSAYVVDYLPDKWNLEDDNDVWIAAWEHAAKRLLEPVFAELEQYHDRERRMAAKLPPTGN